MLLTEKRSGVFFFFFNLFIPRFSFLRCGSSFLPFPFFTTSRFLFPFRLSQHHSLLHFLHLSCFFFCVLFIASICTFACFYPLACSHYFLSQFFPPSPLFLIQVPCPILASHPISSSPSHSPLHLLLFL